MDWQVVATDLAGGGVVADVPLQSGTWVQTHGRAGTFEGSLPLRKAPPSLLEGAATVLHLVVGGLWVADGIVWDVRVSRDGNRDMQVTLNGESLASYWDHRRLRAALTFDQADEADIVAALVDVTEDGGQGIGIDTSQVAPTGRLRDVTRWDPDDRPTIGHLVRLFQELVAGPIVDVVVARPDPAAPPTRTLTVRPSGAGVAVGGPLQLGRQILGYTAEILGSRTGNDVETVGAGEGASMVVGRAIDATALGGWPRLDLLDVRKDVSEPPTAQAHADAKLASLSRPPVPLQLQLDPDQRPYPSAWRVGDILDVQLVDPPLQVRMPMRAVQRTWHLDDGRLGVSVTCNPTVTDRPNLTVAAAAVPPTLRTIYVTADGNDGPGETWDGNDGPGRILDGNSAGIVTAAPT